MNNLTYEKIIADIINISKHGDETETQQLVNNFCKVFSEFLLEYARRTNGYMFLAAFVVTFTEIKQVAANASGEDKILIDALIKAVIGSYGSTIQ